MDVDSTGTPTKDDMGQFTEEALVDRMLTPVEQEAAPEPVSEPDPEPEPVEPTPEEPAEEVTASDDVEIEEDETIAESDDDVSDAPSMFTVKIDGNEIEVTEEELKRGYSGQQYIQTQMQKVAESRKEAEQIFNQLAQERAQVQQALQMLQDGTLSLIHI